MNINLDISSYPEKIEVKKVSAYSIDIEIVTKGTTLVAEMDIDAAKELMEQLSKQINNYYISDKITELEGDIDELKYQLAELQEEKTRGNWEDVA